MTKSKAPKILIIDDSRSFATLVGAMLRGMGIRSVTAFDDFEAAKAFLHANSVDVVLIDGDMPKSCAFKFAKTLRQDKKQFHRTVPLVLMSGAGGSQVMRRAVEAGFDAVLPKPIRTAQLRDQLTHLMEHPRVYIHARAGYCGPDRRRHTLSDFSGENRRDGDTFQVFTEDGPVSLDQLEKLQEAGTGHADLEVLLVRGVKILSGYRLNARAARAA